MADGRYKLCLVVAEPYRLPVETGKKRMFADIVCVIDLNTAVLLVALVLEATDPLGRVARQQLGEERACLGAEAIGHGHVIESYFLHHFTFVFTEMRRDADHHLVE